MSNTSWNDRGPEPAWIDRLIGVCRAKGAQVTPLRLQVMGIIMDQDVPLGAYDILEKLAALKNQRIAPTTVYRALEFLVESGMVLKIESRQTYVACGHPGHAHHGILLICSSCGATNEVESPAVDDNIRMAAARMNFQPTRHVIEVEGVCARCVASS